MKCWLDTETRSATPISRGTDRYTADAECLLVTWVTDDGAAKIWDRTYDETMPAELWGLLYDPAITLIAHNAQFDRAILDRCLGVQTDIKRWRCTQAQAYSHGLPGSLGTLGAVLDLPEEDRKREDDRKLINLFCIPRPDGSWATRHTHPLEWERFRGYALNDTIALREIHKKLPTHNYVGDNLECWHIDQEINTTGFHFDRELATAAQGLLARAKQRHDGEIDAATEGAVGAATQRAKLLKYLENSGLNLPNMRAATVREWLEHDDLRPEHRFLLELRLEAAKSSGSKYRRGLEVVGAGDRVRYGIQFSGAGRTGRFAGRGFQPHNMSRPTTSTTGPDGRQRKLPVKAAYIADVIIPGILSGAALDEPMLYGGPNEACSNALRGAITAAFGNEFVVADWSNIESRVLAWLAGELWKLDAYRAIDRGEGVDLYKLLVHQFFGLPFDEIDDNWRQSGKVSELAFGFGGGVGALVTMAAVYEIDLDKLVPMVMPAAKEEHKKKAYKAWRRALLRGEDYDLDPLTYQACDILKQVYRASNNKINTFRHDLDDAVKSAIKNPGTCREIARCRVWSTGSWLIIQLPSGRRLLYSKPRLEEELAFDENGNKDIDPKTGLPKKYQYVSYLTARGKSWRRERAWSGLFVENIVQAVANDILRAALRHIQQETDWTQVPAGHTTAIALHVHDEIVCEVPKGSLQLDTLVDWMTTYLLAANDWMHDLPLAAAGWTGVRYKKG